ncbi:hypothetical protein CR513_46287, partial [Mucuna pruriens]
MKYKKTHEIQEAGAYQILKKYMTHCLLNFSTSFSVHTMFSCDSSHVIISDTLLLKDNLTFETMSIQIVDRRIKQF